ncbi:MAG TPA: M20/M25/M40 family metallo-hydrolase, partial [Thermoanaerobaculia bacterium]|nr:M20/M25/M40 family metallo-hydrolase [Thermoanaerobaculia bacterium]
MIPALHSIHGAARPALRSTTFCALIVLLLGLDPLSGADVDLERLQDEAVERLQAYLRIDTTNPPGNEARAVEFLARILEAEGIPYETAESAPGRGNLWARLEGGGEPALVLLHHSDVVPADAARWTVPPFSGELVDGYLYGRGALDMKSTGILQLQTFLALHRAGRPLARDVLLVATADEEAGGAHGAGWLVEQHPELFAGAGLLLNEGGSGFVIDQRTVFGIEVTQKVPYWLRLESSGIPGHGSTPRTDSAVTRLVRALERLRQHEFPARVVPAVDAYFENMAPTVGKAFQPYFENLATAVADPFFLRRLQLEQPGFHALLRNTCSITRLEGSSKINVIPPTAAAEIDCRLLPDQDPAAFLETLATVINDPQIEIQQILLFEPAVSPTDTVLYRAITDVVRRHFPEAVITPAVSTGFTDSHFFRDLGIASYGFA